MSHQLGAELRRHKSSDLFSFLDITRHPPNAPALLQRAALHSLCGASSPGLERATGSRAHLDPGNAPPWRRARRSCHRGPSGGRRLRPRTRLARRDLPERAPERTSPAPPGRASGRGPVSPTGRPPPRRQQPGAGRFPGAGRAAGGGRPPGRARRRRRPRPAEAWPPARPPRALTSGGRSPASEADETAAAALPLSRDFPPEPAPRAARALEDPGAGGAGRGLRGLPAARLPRNPLPPPHAPRRPLGRSPPAARVAPPRARAPGPAREPGPGAAFQSGGALDTCALKGAASPM